MIDPSTLIAGQVILSVIYAGIFYIVHWVYPQLKGILYAVAGFSIASIARIFFMAHGEYARVIANALAFAASGLLYTATTRHFGSSKPTKWIWGTLGLLTLVLSFCQLLKLNMSIRLVTESSAFLLIRLVWARELFRRSVGKPVIAAFAVFMAIYAVYALHLFVGLIPTTGFTPSMSASTSHILQMPPGIVLSIGNVALAAILGFLMLLMVAETIRGFEKVAAASLLASAISHEINNPLQSVTNLLFLLQNADEKIDSDALLQEAQEELARVTHVVTQTLRFHSQSENPLPTQLGEVIGSLLRILRSRIEGAGIAIRVDDGQHHQLLCYQADIRQVLSNLIGNAVDAVNGRSDAAIAVKIRDTVDYKSGKRGVRVAIADNGAGMDDATKKRLFEPFFSTKGARAIGLGLWISREILEKHQAQLRFRSSQHLLWHGTVFTIFLPASITPHDLPSK